MSPHVTEDRTTTELAERHRALYDGPNIEEKLKGIIRSGSPSKLSDWDVHRILRTSRAVLFDTHVEVVSGHHTATYLRFESIARIPQLMTLIARDMADWIHARFALKPITGLLATSSDAQLLAQQIAGLIPRQLPMRVVLTHFDPATGRIGTDLASGVINAGERFVVLNDVTTRGNCVSKLGNVVTDHGAVLAGMMVFARRDSGQFPMMEELPKTHPFYYTADLDMPQWEAGQCPLCQAKEPLLSWKDMPEISER